MNVFDILKKINQDDEENKTRYLALSNAFVSGRKVKQGAIIEMGVEDSMLVDLMTNKRRAVILLIDNDAYAAAEKSLKEVTNEQL